MLKRVYQTRMLARCFVDGTRTVGRPVHTVPFCVYSGSSRCPLLAFKYVVFAFHKDSWQ